MTSGTLRQGSCCVCLQARQRLAALSASRTTSNTAAKPALQAARRTSNSSSLGTSTPPSRPPAGNSSSGWDRIDDAGEGWDSLDAGGSNPSAPSTVHSTSTSGAGSAISSPSTSVTGASHRAAARPARQAAVASGTGFGAKPAQKGSMKLGASKLGAQKIQLNGNEQW